MIRRRRAGVATLQHRGITDYDTMQKPTAGGAVLDPERWVDRDSVEETEHLADACGRPGT